MPARKPKEYDAMDIDPRHVPVVKAFAQLQDICQENRKGFGSGALKVNGKIFAMMSSRRQFVVKLPKDRVDELVNRGKGQRFEPGHGRIMKEWFVVGRGKANWVELAEEAYNFVKQGKPGIRSCACRNYIHRFPTQGNPSYISIGFLEVPASPS